jgi:hypothetical protein
VRNPLVEQASIMGLHQLIASCKIFVDPTGDVDQAVRSHTSAIAKAAIYGDGIFVLEVLYHHIKSKVWHDGRIFDAGAMWCVNLISGWNVTGRHLAFGPAITLESNLNSTQARDKLYP